MKDAWNGPLEQIDDYRWRIPKSYRPGMRVDGIIYANRNLIEQIRSDNAPEQVANVAHLPGIVGASLAMPDIHWGYGFPIGGVAATDPDREGVISPGGVGYDINCGVRLMRTDLTLREVEPKIRELVEALFHQVPCGVGMEGSVKFSHAQERRILAEGASFVVEQGFGLPRDLEYCEAGGALAGADPEAVSQPALERGKGQVGTLGSGNHFLEVQLVDQVYDQPAARKLGLEQGQVTVMIHSGSRGLGHQVCTDALKDLRDAPARYGYDLPDRQLACAPVNSPEGQHYLGSMRAAANYAWANRQLLMVLARQVLVQVFESAAGNLDLVYDVAHNIAKLETYPVEGVPRTLCVHRKGATRAFPPGHPELPAAYQTLGQPVIIPGDMGRYSFVLLGRQPALEQTFGSVCHGAGRRMSRTEAKKSADGRQIQAQLEARGIIVRARGWAGLAEEQSAAYKDVAEVVEVIQGAGLAAKVVRLRPLGVIKG